MWNTISYLDNIFVDRYWINEDGLIKNKNNKIIQNRDNGFGYRIIDLYYGNGNKKTLSVHRLVAETYCIKKKETHTEIDHIDNNRSNNNKSNLRFIDKSGNNRNTNRYNKTGFRGITELKNKKYKAVIRINRIKTHLGVFDNPQEANAKYEEMYNQLMEEY